MNSHLLMAQLDVEDFMREAGQTLREYPSIPTPAELDLRIDLITEEHDETINALLACKMGGGPDIAKMAEVADGIADAIYVLLGTASAFGIDMSSVWDEVQRSNMEKMTGPIREDGKRLKPKDWRPPDIVAAIQSQYGVRE